MSSDISLTTLFVIYLFFFNLLVIVHFIVIIFNINIFYLDIIFYRLRYSIYYDGFYLKMKSEHYNNNDF